MKVKTDLFTSIVAAIAGVLIAFFVTNMFIGPIEDVSYKKVGSSVNANITDPDPEVFNYKALNPTVEVYVGECIEYNQYGECVEVNTDIEEVVEEVEEEIEEEIEENNQTDQGTQSESENQEQENQ